VARGSRDFTCRASRADNIVQGSLDGIQRGGVAFVHPGRQDQLRAVVDPVPDLGPVVRVAVVAAVQGTSDVPASAGLQREVPFREEEMAVLWRGLLALVVRAKIIGSVDRAYRVASRVILHKHARHVAVALPVVVALPALVEHAAALGLAAVVG